MKPKVFVAQPIPEVALDVLREAADIDVYPYMDRQISVDELVANAKRSDWLFVLHETNVTAEVIYANPNLQGIGAMASSDPLIDMDAANARKIPIVLEDPKATFPGVAPTTADLTMAMLLGLAYRLVESDRYTRAGGFRQEQTMALMGIGCPGKTVDLIGLGRVGKLMVPRLLAFELHVLYTKPTRLTSDEERTLGVEWVEHQDHILRRSDFVCMEASYNPNTHELVGKRELHLMKPTAYFINTGRGRLVNESALIEALQDGTIAGAGLDVFWNEPPVSHDPFVPLALRKLDNVVLAPHNGGATWDSRGAQTSAIARNIVAHIKGEYVTP